jgi:DNA-binding MarR family transcriptional regulator
VSSSTTTATPPRVAREERLDFVAENLLSRAAVLVRLLVKQVRSREISRTEMEVLSILRDGPRTITELTDLAGIAQPTMTLLVKRLQERGWIAREGVPDDGRVVLVRLTDAGDEAQQKFRARFRAALRSDLEELPDEQLAALSTATRVLDSFVEDLQQRTV